jgi:predicted branched-subunit amino acid permease
LARDDNACMTVSLKPAPLWHEPEFGLGVREMAVVSLGMAAWGLVTGMAMVNSGLGVPLSVFMSLVVYAGSAQLAALPLLAAGAPLWLILGTALCVNLRFVIFSAQWRPFFMHLSRPKRLWHAFLATDMSFVLFMKRYAVAGSGQPAQTVPLAHAAHGPLDGNETAVVAAQRGPMAYFWGGAITNWLAWQTSSMAGIFLADSIPGHWGIGFAGTLALLALSCSMITDRITVVTAGAAATAALVAFALPMRLNIVAAIAAGVALGVMLDYGKGLGNVPGSGSGTDR